MERVELVIIYLDTRNNKIIYKQIDNKELGNYSSVEDYAEECKPNNDTCWMLLSEQTEVEFKLIKGTEHENK